MGIQNIRQNRYQSSESGNMTLIATVFLAGASLVGAEMMHLRTSKNQQAAKATKVSDMAHDDMYSALTVLQSLLQPRDPKWAPMPPDKIYGEDDGQIADSFESYAYPQYGRPLVYLYSYPEPATTPNPQMTLVKDGDAAIDTASIDMSAAWTASDISAPNGNVTPLVVHTTKAMSGSKFSTWMESPALIWDATATQIDTIFEPRGLRHDAVKDQWWLKVEATTVDVQSKQSSSLFAEVKIAPPPTPTCDIINLVGADGDGLFPIGPAPAADLTVTGVVRDVEWWICERAASGALACNGPPTKIPYQSSFDLVSNRDKIAKHIQAVNYPIRSSADGTSWVYKAIVKGTNTASYVCYSESIKTVAGNGIASIKINPNSLFDGVAHISIDFVTGVVRYWNTGSIRSGVSNSSQVKFLTSDAPNNKDIFTVKRGKTNTLKQLAPGTTSQLAGNGNQNTLNAQSLGFSRVGSSDGNPPTVRVINNGTNMEIIIDDDKGDRPGMVRFSNFDLKIVPPQIGQD